VHPNESSNPERLWWDELGHLLAFSFCWILWRWRWRENTNTWWILWLLNPPVSVVYIIYVSEYIPSPKIKHPPETMVTWYRV
jgi:hypothetical protein